MMISPEGYYEVNLKGKSQQDILKEIRSLKREINQLKVYGGAFTGIGRNVSDPIDPTEV